MKVRDPHLKINGVDSQYDISSDVLDIIADDGRELFSIALGKDGSIRIDAPGCCKHNGVILDSAGLSIMPIASNCFHVKRRELK